MLAFYGPLCTFLNRVDLILILELFENWVFGMLLGFSGVAEASKITVIKIETMFFKRNSEMGGKTKLGEKKLTGEFESSEDLQSEFGSVEAYISFRLAESQGRIRGLKSNVLVAASSADSGPGPGPGDGEETLKKAFAALSADERAEYGDVEAYIAFKQADANGQVRYAPRNN